MTATLPVTLRTETGTAAIRRLRQEARVPAILYGHGEANVNLSLETHAISTLIDQGVQAVELSGALTETVLIREIQWDTFGREILHLDFQRVSAREKVEVTVAIELLGEAPGVKQGGVVEQLLHEVDIECPATAIPKSLEVNINDLELNDSVRASALVLPKGAKLLVDDEQMIVQCAEMAAEVEAEEEEGVAADHAEPEVIRRESEEEED
jgi:large subunit ribosomal protein L25